MKKYFILFSPCLLLFSCSPNKKSDSPVIAGDTAATSAKAKPEDNSFFPVTSFLQGQMFILDSLPVTILQLTTVNNNQDSASAWLPVAKVKPQLKPFISDIIDKDNLAAFFKETKFNDQSTEAITFTYEPKTTLPDSISLRRWDVYVDPDKGTVRRVYIVKQVKDKNITSTQQLTWQTGKWAKIVTIKNEPGAKGQSKSEIKWIWDLSE